MVSVTYLGSYDRLLVIKLLKKKQLPDIFSFLKATEMNNIKTQYHLRLAYVFKLDGKIGPFTS